MKLQTKCLWCPDQIHFDFQQGWVHSNGLFKKTYFDKDGKERDDHVATPNFPNGNEVELERS